MLKKLCSFVPLLFNPRMPDASAQNPLDPTEVDLQIVEDEALGHPVKRCAHQGVADMQARITQLNAEKKKLLEQMDTRTDLDSQLSTLNSQLREAQDRLAEYELQAQSHN